MKIIKYGAPWCHMCKNAESVLKKAGLEFIDINVEDNEELAIEKNIRSIPYIEFYKDETVEKPFFTQVGSLTTEDLNKIKALLC